MRLRLQLYDYYGAIQIILLTYLLTYLLSRRKLNHEVFVDQYNFPHDLWNVHDRVSEAVPRSSRRSWTGCAAGSDTIVIQVRMYYYIRSWRSCCIGAGQALRVTYQVAALICVKWRHGRNVYLKIWRQIENLTRQSMRIYPRNNPDKFHPDRIWNVIQQVTGQCCCDGGAYDKED